MSVQPLDCEIAEVVWWGTQTLRVRAHAARGVSRCPTRVVPYSAADPRAQHLHVRCWEDGCLGIVHAVYLTTLARLQRRATQDRLAVTDKLRYARRVVASQVAELDRAGRVSRGLPAKPTRSDGVPGRILAALRTSTEDPKRLEWLEQLFRMVRGFVCREHRRAAIWPTDMWAAEKSVVDGRFRALGTAVVRREIEGDIHEVLKIAREVAGDSWVAANILHPFLTVVGPLPEEFDIPGTEAEDDPTERAALVSFRARYAALRRAGWAPEAAFRQACAAVYGCDPRGAVADAIADLEAWFRGA